MAFGIRPFFDGLRRMLSRRILPTSLGSREIGLKLDGEIKRAAMFSARVEHARVLQRLRDTVGEIVLGVTPEREALREAGEAPVLLSMADAKLRLQQELDAIGYQPAVDEGDALRRYFTNNLAYRQQGGWAVTETGYIRSDAWLNYATVTGTNNSVSWTAGTASVAGRTDRWVLHGHELGAWSPGLVTAGGEWTRAFFVQLYKSYGMEESVGQATYRRHLFPGFAQGPLALLAGWGLGSFSSANFFWMATAANATVADALSSSAVRYGGYMPWEYPICGDLTLPIDAITQSPPGVATVETLVVQ